MCGAGITTMPLGYGGWHYNQVPPYPLCVGLALQPCATISIVCGAGITAMPWWGGAGITTMHHHIHCVWGWGSKLLHAKQVLCEGELQAPGSALLQCPKRVEVRALDEAFEIK